MTSCLASIIFDFALFYLFIIECATRAKPPPCRICGWRFEKKLRSVFEKILKLLRKLGNINRTCDSTSLQKLKTWDSKSTPKPWTFELQELRWSPLATAGVVLGCLEALLEVFGMIRWRFLPPAPPKELILQNGSLVWVSRLRLQLELDLEN